MGVGEIRLLYRAKTERDHIKVALKQIGSRVRFKSVAKKGLSMHLFNYFLLLLRYFEIGVVCLFIFITTINLKAMPLWFEKEEAEGRTRGGLGF